MKSTHQHFLMVTNMVILCVTLTKFSSLSSLGIISTLMVGTVHTDFSLISLSSIYLNSSDFGGIGIDSKLDIVLFTSCDITVSPYIL